MAYSVFDDPKLYKKPDTRNWNPKTGNGWRRNKEGDWQYYANFEALEGKLDKSGVKDVANLGKDGWNVLPTKKVEPIPQRPHNWFDSAPIRDAYASQPGTGQFIRLPEDMQTTTAEDRANLATAKAAQDTDIANQKSIGATNARASLMKAASRQSSSKGSVGKNLLTLQEMRNEQNPVAQASAATTNNVQSVQTQSQAPTTPKMNLNLKSLDEASATRIGNMQSLFNNASPERLEQLRNNPRMAEDLLRDAGKGIGVGGGEAAGLGAAGGMQIAGKVLQMLDPKGG